MTQREETHILTTTSLNATKLCYLETIGRVSGKPHEIEIWFAAGPGNRIYLLSGGRERADWVKNLKSNPAVRVRIDDHTYSGTAAVIEHGTEDRPAREALAAKYQGWTAGAPLSNWARTSLPVAIDLEL